MSNAISNFRPTRPSLFSPLFFLALTIATLLPVVDDGSHCFAQGFPNVQRTKGELLAGPLAPNQGRTAVIAYQQGYIVSNPEGPGSAPGSDYASRVWNISDPRNPTSNILEGIGANAAVGAHGYWQESGMLYGVGGIGGRTLVDRNSDGRLELADRIPYGPTTHWRNPNDNWPNRGLLFQPFTTNMWWSYGATDHLGYLMKRDQQLALWDHIGLTGVIGHPFVLGNILYILSDSSMTGMAAYDLTPTFNSPGTPPRLISTQKGRIGGYWPEIWGGDGKLIAVFPNRGGGHVQFADITDPANMFIVGDRNYQGNSDPSYVQFQDHFAFTDGFKINMRTFDLDLVLDTHGRRIDASQYAMPIGNLLVTGGYPVPPKSQGMAIWAHQAEPDTNGPSVGFHIPRNDQQNFPRAAPISVLIHETLREDTVVNGSTFIVRPISSGGTPGQAISGRLVIAFDDVLTFTPDQDLQANTTYEVFLPAGGIRDAVGNGMIEYRFRFSTGSGIVAGESAPVISSFSISPNQISPGQSATLSSVASDPDGDAIEYRFEFGDNTPGTGWIASSSAPHTYQTTGHFNAVVQVRDTSGMVTSLSRRIAVVSPVSGNPPLNNSPIVYDPARQYVWTVNPDNDSLARINQNRELLEIPLGDGANPRSVALDSSGNAWVACHGSDRIVVIAPSGSTVTTISTGYGSAPFGIVPSPNRSSLFVTLYGEGHVVRFNATTRQETARLAVGPTPRALAISGDGQRLLVTRFISDNTGGQVWDIATGSGLLLTRTLSVREDTLTKDNSSNGRGIPNYLTSIAISPQGTTALITGKQDNHQRGILANGTDLNQENTTRALVYSINLSTNTELYRWSANREINRLHSERRDIDNSDSPTSVTFSPRGDYAFVTLQGNNMVVIYDMLVDLRAAVTAQTQVMGRLTTGTAPQGAYIDPGTGTLYVQDFMSRTVSYLDINRFLSGESSSALRTSISSISLEILPANVLRGKRIFYNASDTGGSNSTNRMSADGYASCASCHVDGGHDGRTWDFTGRLEGFRNTQDLRGKAGMNHGNLHWSGNFDEVQDFETVIRLHQGGTGFMTNSDFNQAFDPLGIPKAGRNQDLDALAAYVTSLGNRTVPKSPFRNNDGTMSSLALQGQAVFASEGCATCHAGTKFTESAVTAQGTLRNVGTLTTASGQRLGAALSGIDTPTLLGLWQSAPYLHDGSAETLPEVFTAAGGNIYQFEEASYLANTNIDMDAYGGNFHKGRGVAFSGESGIIRFDTVDGGAGGSARLTIRASSRYHPNPFTLRVNGGTPMNIVVQRTANEPGWASTDFRYVSVDVALTAGRTNTIEFSSANAQSQSVTFDEMKVSTASDFAAAAPHRRIEALAADSKDALIRYLLELDGSSDTSAPNATPMPTRTPLVGATATATRAPTNTASATPTTIVVSTATPTRTATQTPAATFTSVVVATATRTPVNTATPNPTMTPTSTTSSTVKVTQTPTIAPTSTATTTRTATRTATPTSTSIVVATATRTPVKIATPNPTMIPNRTATSIATPTAKITQTPTGVATSTATATSTANRTPAATATSVVVATATKTPTSPEPTASPVSTATPKAMSTVVPDLATATPTPGVNSKVPVILRVDIYNSNGQFLQKMTRTTVLYLDRLKDKGGLEFRAVTTKKTAVVRLVVRGKRLVSALDRTAPFSLQWAPAIGEYTFIGQPFNVSHGEGVLGVPVNFKLIVKESSSDGSPKIPTATPVPNKTPSTAPNLPRRSFWDIIR